MSFITHRSLHIKEVCGIVTLPKVVVPSEFRLLPTEGQGRRGTCPLEVAEDQVFRLRQLVREWTS